VVVGGRAENTGNNASPARIASNGNTAQPLFLFPAASKHPHAALKRLAADETAETCEEK